MTEPIRTVTRIIHPQPVQEGAGVLLRRSMPTRVLNYLDPFLLLDHFGSDDPLDYLPGFPMHPHRGIETVTYMLSGEVRHQDSLGNAGVIGAGDLQWMTAGRGILHEEMPKPVKEQMYGFQLWVNLPAAHKMTRPRYQEVRSGSIPEVTLPEGARVRVIAGSVGCTSGAVSEIVAEPVYLDVILPAGTRFVQAVAPGHTAFAYVFEGSGSLGGAAGAVAAVQLAVFSDGEEVQAQAGAEGMRFLLVSGKPLNEPVARYGPFVMNTQEEIAQTLRELREGTFIRG